MATQVTGRKRIPNREKLTAEEDALSQIAREAEARLAAKRAARAEAREIRMKELEKQQKEIYHTQKKYYGLDTKWGRIEQWMEDSERYSHHSRRHTSISDEEERLSVGSRGSLRGNYSDLCSSSSCLPSSRLQNGRPSDYSGFLGSSSRTSSRASSARASPVVEERADFLEKASRTASTLSAATLASLGGGLSRRGSCDTSISADTEASIREMKDSLTEAEEKYRRAMVSNAQLDNEKSTLMYQVDTLRETLLELEEQLYETQRECEEKTKEYEREHHAHTVLQFQFSEMKNTLQQTEELLKKHGIVLGPEVSTNGESGGGLVEPPEDVDSASSLPHNLQTSIITGDSMLERPAEDQDPGLDSTTGRSSSPSLESVFQEEDQRSAAEDADTGTVRSAKAAGFVAQALVEFHQSNNDAVVQIQAIQPSEISDGTKVEQLLRADCGPEACSGRLENHEEQNTKQLVSVYLMQVVDDIHMDCTKHSRTETVQGGVSDRQNQGDALSNESRSGNEWKRGKVDLALALEHLLQEEGGALEHLLQEEGGALEHLLQEQGGALEHLLQEEGGALEHLLQEEGGALEHLVQEEGGALEHLLQEEGGALEHLVQKEGGALEAIKAPDNQTKKTTHLNENIKEALGAQQNNSQPVESYLPESASIPQKKHCDEGTAKEMKRARLNRRGQEVIKAPNVPEVERTSTLRETHPLTQQCVTEPAHETLSMSVREEKGFALFLDSCQEAGALDFEVFTREQEDKPSAETQKEADTTGNKVKSTRVKPRTDNTHDCCVS
ncbi:uncharacterized protein lrrfip1b isoform X5 [Electrophorus electricus]|uniref:uncharacterized protein lrrfip1b isoform X5 n=1 Tax=Electrophorus electricus TaxID=8005 RepID=UPI0015D0BCFC|nr:uncharacterized protein lrrfip1b isoform X5 [Electrophorus electricus]